MSSIVLHYQLEPPEGSSTLLVDEDIKRLKRLGMEDGKLSLRITLAAQEIRFAYGEGKQRVLGLELHTGRRTWIDHALKEKLILDQTPEFLKLLKSQDGAWQIEQSTSSKQFNISGLNLLAQHMHLVGKLVTIEAWIAQPVLDLRKATQMLWMLLVPGSSVATTSLGIPLELEIADAKSHHDILLRWKLLEYTSSEKEPDPLQAPADYKEPVIKSPDTKVLAKTKIVDVPIMAAKTAKESLFEQSNKAAALAGILSGLGDDLAWIAREPLLAQMKEVVNKISSVFDCYKGDGEGGNKPMHVVVDWWKDLEPKLVFSNKDNAMRALKLLLFSYRVMEGLALEGMNEQEQETYEEILARYVDEERILPFWATFQSGRLHELADINFQQLTKPVYLEFKTNGEPIYSLRKNDIADLVDLKLWDFDTEIDLAHQQIIKDLKFGAGVIELVLELPYFKTDFQFWTKPNGSWLSIVLAPALFNYGYGAFTASSVKVTLRIGAVQQAGTTTFQVQVDADKSHVYAIAELYGVNLISDIAAGVCAVLVFWLDLWKPMVLDIVNQALTKICSQPALGWPAFWHARNGPPVVSDGVDHSLRILKAQLATNPADLPESSSETNFTKASMAGFAVSRQYLTAWLRNLLGEYAADRILEIDWQGQFGVTLPDIATFPIPETLTQNVDGTTVYESSRYYRTRIHRLAPVVNLHANGQSAASGTAEIRLTLTLEAVVKLGHSKVGVVTPGRTRVVETSKIPGTGLPEIERGPGTIPDLGGVPRVPGGGGSPGGGGMPGPFYAPALTGGGSAAVMIEPPEVQFRSYYTEHAIATLLEATFSFSNDLRLGFNKDGNMWLPELCLTLYTSCNALDLQPTPIEWWTHECFAGADLDSLQQVIENICLGDAKAILQRGVAGAPPSTTRYLVPEVAQYVGTGASELVDLVVYRQQEHGESADLSYVVDGSLVYWPIEIVQTITSHISG